MTQGPSSRGSAARPPAAAAPPQPAISRGGGSPLVELIRCRLLEFCREPEAIFWVYGFPLLMVLSLGIAYRQKPIERPRVDVVAGPRADADRRSLGADGSGLRAEVAERSAALERLRTGRSDLVVERDDDRGLLAAVEYARPQVDAAARVLPAHTFGRGQISGGSWGICSLWPPA